jgi:hypothetical protein
LVEREGAGLDEDLVSSRFLVFGVKHDGDFGRFCEITERVRQCDTPSIGIPPIDIATVCFDCCRREPADF